MLQDTQNQTDLARNICVYAHVGQTDKAGMPYHLHPEYVASQVTEPDEKIAALLHDVLEDTDFPLSILKAVFNDEIIQALLLLRHDENVPYMEYIVKVSTNKIAKAVKIADLKHNMDISRIPNPTEKDYVRLEKYKAALEILNNTI
ncbi:MAG: GTP pyrophosphokinase [Clostridiales bacterium]|nr:GTP pyrophosphokinase [Clostridiales bacterium]